MIKVVFDSNVFISAFGVPGSKSEEAYLLAVRRKISLFASPAILTETANNLRVKFGGSDRNITSVLKRISRVSTIIKPEVSLDTLAHEPDNRILECAFESKANLIISGDKHLRQLKSYEGIAIITVPDLLHSFPRK